jgi:SAM-dependent methyltransferase
VSTFKDVELSGWTEKAAAYDHYFASITVQAAEPALDLIGNMTGKKVLDICCGTGDLAAMALQRGATVTGIDFAPTMVEIATSKVPQADFSIGDAEDLEFKDGEFDAALCSFGLWHMADPDRAIAEAARVLKRGGIFIYTTWLPPSKGWDMFDIIVQSINTHGSMEVDLPPAPPPFRFADEKDAGLALTAQGYEGMEYREKMAIWNGESGQDLLDMIYKSIVRAPMMIEAQSPSARDAIKRDIVAKAEAMRTDGVITMRWPYSLVSAVRL